ncbi:Gfo/Idh/MocA family oxidoreductase [Kineococcus glutinatus]|uniref:Gfo/Idh/MocA family oxidoreductase n=1 Tax=Kineococcus glutinatus TaxID=1070872 RepID=A0ABP9H9N9_9ACTN
MSAPAVLGVGVVGTGVMGADHARTLARSVSGARLVAVTDVDAARAGAVAGELGVGVAADAAALLADPAVDAVVVASHDATHAGLVRAAVAAGTPVLCEKPLAPTLAEAAAVLADIGPRGAELLSLGFMRRFDPGYAELRATLERGGIGAPLLVHCVSRGVSSGPGATSESSLTGSAVHEFDVVPWLLRSPVVEVSWSAPHHPARVPGLVDPQVVLLRTASGALATVEVFLNAGYGYDIRCEVVGEGGAASLAEPVRTVLDGARTRSTGYAADWRPRFADAYRLQLQAWVDAVAAGTPAPLATGRDGVLAAAVADAAITSMRAGGGPVPVEVPQVAR